MQREQDSSGQDVRVVQIAAAPFEIAGDRSLMPEPHFRLYALRSDGAIFFADTTSVPIKWWRTVDVPGCFDPGPDRG